MDDFYKPSGSDAPESTREKAKIFVGALSWQTTEDSLRSHFEKYGPVQSVELVRDRHTGGTKIRML
jgi:RNA recognition motif-containing protein